MLRGDSARDSARDRERHRHRGKITHGRIDRDILNDQHIELVFRVSGTDSSGATWAHLHSARPTEISIQQRVNGPNQVSLLVQG